MQAEQLDFVSVATRDVARTAASYRDVLGLARPNSAGLVLRVAGVEAAVAEAREGGAAVMRNEDRDVCHMGLVRNPAGNVLILHRRYAPHPQRGEG